MRTVQRSTDEVIVLTLCALCMMGLGLFVIIRALRGDAGVALLDGAGLVVTTLLFVHVWRTHSLRVAGPLLALTSLGGAVALIALGGAGERYLLYPTTVVSFFLMTPARALVASFIAVAAASMVLLPDLDAFVFGKFLLSVCGCFLFACVFAHERNRQKDELLALSTHDSLTGLGNRRAFDARVDEILRINSRAPVAVSLVFLDLDHFKMVNDRQGHDAGDQVLRQIADILASRIRASDYACRFGGDEFAVVAMGDGVLHLAEDLCARVADYAAEAQLPISTSIGVAVLSPSDTSASWCKRADGALYEAKSAGRNRVHSDAAEPDNQEISKRSV